jgi:hypothetical protein
MWSDSTWNVAQRRRKGTRDLLASLVLFFAIFPVLAGNSKKDPLTRVPESKFGANYAVVRTAMRLRSRQISGNAFAACWLRVGCAFAVRSLALAARSLPISYLQQYCAQRRLRESSAARSVSRSIRPIHTTQLLHTPPHTQHHHYLPTSSTSAHNNNTINNNTINSISSCR